MAEQPQATTRVMAAWQMLDDNKDKLSAALNRQRNFDQWLEVAKAWVMKLEDMGALKRVTTKAFLYGFLDAAKYGLMVDGKEGMLIPRGGEGKTKFGFEIGAEGVIRKASDAGWSIRTGLVREGDSIKMDFGDATVSHSPAWVEGQDDGEIRGAWALGVHHDGRRVLKALSKKEVIENHRPNKDFKPYEPWIKFEGAMITKTVVLQMRKSISWGDDLDAIMRSEENIFDDPETEGNGRDEEPSKTRQPNGSANKAKQEGLAKRMQASQEEEPPPPADEESFVPDRSDEPAGSDLF